MEVEVLEVDFEETSEHRAGPFPTIQVALAYLNIMGWELRDDHPNPFRRVWVMEEKEARIVSNKGEPCQLEEE